MEAPLSAGTPLHRAIESFIRAHCNFESSLPIDGAVDEIANCATLQEVYAIPLQRQLFSLDSALRWVFFLSLAAGKENEEFSTQDALALVSQVYDLGTQEMVWEHFDDDDDDDDDNGASDGGDTSVGDVKEGALTTTSYIDTSDSDE